MHRSITLAICAIVASTAFAAPDGFSLTGDPGFDNASTGDLGKWEIRYVRRMKVPTTRPNWKVEIRTNDKAPAHGKYLSLEDPGQASGVVYIGQIVTVPKGKTPLGFSLDYQTYCQSKNRSGIVNVVAMTPEVWRRIATTPADASKPDIVKTLMSSRIQKQGDDVTEWKRGTASRRDMQRFLARYAGKEVVIAVEWEAWHHTAEEWARFDNIRFGSPAPFVALGDISAYTYRTQPLAVVALTHGWGDHSVRIEYRPASGGEWKSVAADPLAPGRFMARVPSEAVGAPLQVRARMQHEKEEPVMTKAKIVKITEPRKQHPCLFYTPETIEQCKRRIQKFDWARKYYETQKELADQWLARDEDPPLAKAGWGHDYVCADCGQRLTFREDHPHKHLCKNCHKEWEGPKLDRFWNLRIHGMFRHAAAACALVYQIEGDEKYARRAIRIVDWYSSNYPKFTSADSRPKKGGRLFSQSLSESSWLVSMMDLTDLVYTAMTEDERWRFENQLVRPCAEHVYTYTHRVHNIQNWKNAALGGAGYLLNDPDMIDRALNDPKLGFHRQIDEGVLEDGMWYERSIGYHYYALSAITNLVVPALHAGTDLRNYGRLPMMYAAPLQFVQPDLVPPSLNDMGYKSEPMAPNMLEYAIAWYDDKNAARAAHYLYAHGFERDHEIAFMWGDDIPDYGEFRQPPSANMPGMGLAVLRHGAGSKAIYAALEYGEHGGGHGHPDKLQLILYGIGRPLAADLGTTGYGVPMHGEYYKTTPGHNTVTIGGKNQEKTTGECLAFEASENYASAVVESDGAYPGYRLLRRALVGDGFLVDVFDIVGDKPDTMDWFARAPGTLSLSIDAQPIDEKPLSKAYTYMKDLRGGATDGQWQAQWKEPEQDGVAGTLLLDMLADPGTQVAQSVAPGPRGQKWDTLRVRRQAATTRFVAVWRVATPDPPSLTLSPDSIQIGQTSISLKGPIDALLKPE